jgi:hypothetical protein
LSTDKILARLFKVLPGLESPTSFSGTSGLETVEAGNDGEWSFGGGVGGFSLSLCSGLSGSNWRRISWREALRLWLWADGLGGGEGGESWCCDGETSSILHEPDDCVLVGGATGQAPSWD